MVMMGRRGKSTWEGNLAVNFRVDSLYNYQWTPCRKAYRVVWLRLAVPTNG